MNLEVITVPPVLPPPVRTYVLTLTEVEAQALKMLTSFQSRASITNAARNTVSGRNLQDRELETIRVVNDKVFDALHNAGLADLPASK